ncbi:MAG: winged helix-turn-helix domain-containing protein [Bryobacterales bacterium]|nr:winged helix-turn-helix domain-containing protein [Bryobacterales bacterium]
MAYHFGAFRYEAEERVLYRGAERVALVPKVADTLHVLIERHGKVVEKAELMRLVWPDAVVEEIGLARNISLLRKALGDEEAESPVIETVPKRGYRFAAEVRVDGAVVPAPVSRRRWWWPVATAALLAMGLGYYQFYVPSRFLTGGEGTALAVVPFVCHCEGSDAFSEGLTDVLVAELSGLQGVHVVAPSTVRRHQRAGVSMGLMGRLLGLDTLVEGSVQKLGEELRSTVRLVDVHTGKVIWAGTFDQPSRDLAAAQRVTARGIRAGIGASLSR